MDFGAGAGWLVIPVQIFFVDLLLGADNALLIALACRSLDPEDTRRAIALGAGGAVALRLALTLLASSLLALPLVKLAGAWLLIVIALNATAVPGSDERKHRPFPLTGGGLWSAATNIVVADAAMSLDNVVALAAIARGNFWLLVAGVAFSIPVLAYGGMILSTLLKTAPALIAIGAALLGWIAGDMAVSDPLIADWANVNSPGLVAIAPALGAAFVFLRGRASASRPAPPPAPRPAKSIASAALLPRPPRPIEPELAPSSREDRFAVTRVLILAAIAGLTLLVVSYFDSLN